MGIDSMDASVGVDDARWSLLEDERIIWSGRPATGWLLTGSDLFLVPFSLLWGGFAVFWEVSVFESSAPLIFRLWGIPFVLMGLYFIVGRFVLDAWLRGKTRYAVTNRRILIDRSAPWGSLTVLSLDRLPEVQLSQRPGGRGTLRFGLVTRSWGQGRGGFGTWSSALDPTPQFIAIDGAQYVFDRIQRAARDDT